MHSQEVVFVCKSTRAFGSFVTRCQRAFGSAWNIWVKCDNSSTLNWGHVGEKSNISTPSVYSGFRWGRCSFLTKQHGIHIANVFAICIMRFCSFLQHTSRHKVSLYWIRNHSSLYWKMTMTLMCKYEYIYNHPGTTRMWNWMELTIAQRIIPIWVQFTCPYFLIFWYST